MHGDLNRISVHQCLNALRLVSVGQLVCCINIDLYLASGCLFHELAKFSAALSPGTGLRGGTGEVPGLLFPSKIAVITDLVKIHVRTGIAAFCLTVRSCNHGSAVGTVCRHSLRKECGNGRYIGDQKKYSHGCHDHRHNCPGNLWNVHFHTFFQLNGNGYKEVYANRRRYLADRKVYRCHDTEGNHVISQVLTYRKHDRNEDIHGRVCIDEAACDQEDHIHDQKEGELVVGNAAEQIGSGLRDTEFCTYKGKQGCTCHDQHDAACGLSGLNKEAAKIL